MGLIDYSSQTTKKVTTKGNKQKHINVSKIMYIFHEEGMSYIVLDDGTKIDELKTLKKFEAELSNLGFFRIRDNVIINGYYIKETDKKIRKRNIKINGTEFVIAKKRLKNFKKWIDSFDILITCDTLS